MKHILTLILLFILLSNIKAQDTTYSQLFDIEYRNVDFSKSSSNIIFERSFNFSSFNLQKYTEIDTINCKDFLRIYNQIYNSQLSQSTTLQNSSKNLKNNTKDLITIPIGIIYCNYSMIDSNAFQYGRLYYNNNILYEDTTLGFSTFKLDTALFIAPLQYSVAGTNLEFIFSTNYFYSNLSNSIDSIKIDFNDGIGFRSVNLSNNLFSVNYSSEGIKTIVFQIFIGNKLIIKKSQIKYSEVKSLPYDSNNNIPFDDDAEWADVPFLGYAPFNTTNSYGRFSIRYYYANDDKKLRKPIIISDGFDPGNYRTFEMSLNEDNEWESGGIWSLLTYDENGITMNAGQRLHLLGYDLVVVDYPDGADYIEKNGLAFMKVINMVNQKLKANGSNEQIVVVGPSMGGQISRYALSYMEKNPTSPYTNNGYHNVRLWVSFDSPHQGANITYGVQTFLHYLARVAEEDEALEVYQRKIENVPASWQQLIYHVQGNQDVFNTYYDNINTLGFPENLRKIAITNGRLDGIMDGHAEMEVFSVTYINSNPLFKIYYAPKYHNQSLVGDFRKVGYLYKNIG